ncbi:MAG: NUDIX domain-containing protein [Gemmobacter sp.]
MGQPSVALTDFFFYGTLCHQPLLETVLGRKVEVEPARLADHAVFWAAGQSFPLIVQSPGAEAEGVLVRGLSPEDVARLDFYEGGFAYHTRTVQLSGGGHEARVYFPDPGHWTPGQPWRLGDWVARYGSVVLATAEDFMALFGQKESAEVLDRYRQMLVRGASRVRARSAEVPATVRRVAAADDIDLIRRREPYAHFFAVEEYDLRHRRFDGRMSAAVNRAAFVSGDAATVLPYDPARDRVLLIEQFRPGPYARGDRNAWMLEPVAGRIDPFETPEDCARREAREEAGLEIGALHPVARFYPSPGAKTEFLFSFVGIADLPDGAAGLHGAADENEDIRGHLVPFARLMDLALSLEGANAPLIITAMWLQANRDRLRPGA